MSNLGDPDSAEQRSKPARQSPWQWALKHKTWLVTGSLLGVLTGTTVGNPLKVVGLGSDNSKSDAQKPDEAPNLPGQEKRALTKTDATELNIIEETDIDERWLEGALAWDVTNDPQSKDDPNSRLPNGQPAKSVGVISNVAGDDYEARAVVVQPKGEAPKDLALSIGTFTETESGPLIIRQSTGNVSSVTQPTKVWDYSSEGKVYTAYLFRSGPIVPEVGEIVKAGLSEMRELGLHDGPGGTMRVPGRTMETDQDVIPQSEGPPRIKGTPTLEL